MGKPLSGGFIKAQAPYLPPVFASNGLAQQLKGARYTGQFGYADTLALARGARGDDPYGLRNEFVQLVELAQSLQNPASNPVRTE